MSGHDKRLTYGLNVRKKPMPRSRPPASRGKSIFGAGDASEDDQDGESAAAIVEEIEEFGSIAGPLGRHAPKSEIPRPRSKSKSVVSPGTKTNPSITPYGDLSTSLSSKKHADAAEELDAKIYDYDAVYDSLKPQKKSTPEDIERRPKYMSNLIKAAAVRKRDATIAEEKKLAREREAEGEEFADKEKFVTSAYKKQQEENRRLEEEERLREAKESKENKHGGMTGFFKNVLEKGERRHAEIVKAAEEVATLGPHVEEVEDDNQKSEAEIAREINKQQAGAIAVNDEGQVVDKRQLLKGGLNILPKARMPVPSNTSGRGGSSSSDRSRGAFVGAGGSKQAMRERQTRTMEAQLEQATKRALEADDEQQQKVERAAKSRKTAGEIGSARERYLARKKDAEESKKQGES
ncbi:MAG: hypothetical protein M1818_007159 [Claussenomyces sp. TS43310]|nr:MAG: hypothetical protein M1818_007159 [Claussenomyces sp. TS43310]